MITAVIIGLKQYADLLSRVKDCAALGYKAFLAWSFGWQCSLQSWLLGFRVSFGFRGRLCCSLGFRCLEVSKP